MHNTTSSSWTTPSITRGLPHPSSPAADGMGPALRRWGPWLAAGVMFVALMFSFLSVVQQGVERAGQHQRLAEERGRAEQLCQSQGAYGQRQACMADIQATAALASLR